MLDQAEHGGSLLDVFRRWQGAAGLDDQFAEDVEAARGVASSNEDADPWRD